MCTGMTLVFFLELVYILELLRVLLMEDGTEHILKMANIFRLLERDDLILTGVELLAIHLEESLFLEVFDCVPTHIIN